MLVVKVAAMLRIQILHTGKFPFLRDQSCGRFQNQAPCTRNRTFLADPKYCSLGR